MILKRRLEQHSRWSEPRICHKNKLINAIIVIILLNNKWDEPLAFDVFAANEAMIDSAN